MTNLDKRIEKLNEILNYTPNGKKNIPGCNVMVFTVLPDGCPTKSEVEKQLKQLRTSRECLSRNGSRAIDWSSSGGFMNHTLTGERSSSSPETKISRMYCANAEIPVLCRGIMNVSKPS